MAILIQQKNQKQNILSFVFLIIIAIAVFIVWRGFSEKRNSATKEALIASQNFDIKFDLDVLDNPLLKTLQPFFGIQPFQAATSGAQKIGRENPFLSQ